MLFRAQWGITSEYEKDADCRKPGRFPRGSASRDGPIHEDPQSTPKADRLRINWRPWLVHEMMTGMSGRGKWLPIPAMLFVAAPCAGSAGQTKPWGDRRCRRHGRGEKEAGIRAIGRALSLTGRG